MEQGSAAWLKWRQEGIGGSDAASIMGVSPYRTVLQIYEDKLGIGKPFVPNWATNRGHELEPEARADYELRYQIFAPPALAIHKEYPWLRASLDGYNEELGIILEIKCGSGKDHGTVPEKYFPQLQHQLMVTGAAVVHYYSYVKGQGHLSIVEPDQKYIARLFFEEWSFWYGNVLARKAPK